MSFTSKLRYDTVINGPVDIQTWNVSKFVDCPSMIDKSKHILRQLGLDMKTIF